MRRRRRHSSRALLAEFSSRLGSETLKVRIYRDQDSFICERELVERDGTSFTMVIPFKEPGAARELLAADPHYGRMRDQVARALIKLHSALQGSHGKPSA